MICIYEKTETSFTYNGLGTLEPSYCSFSPYINDVWQLEMYLPYDPEGKYKLVENGRILKVTGIDCIQEQTSNYQLFSIETYRKEGNSIYVLAYPVGMDARFDTYANQVNANYKTAAQAISLINGVKAITLDNQQIDKYTVSTDIDSADLNSAVWNNTNIIAMLTNDENGFIHRWGGEVCYDNYNIKVNQALGRTSGSSEVRYGKNIRGMSYEEDTSNVITRLYPVANGGEILNGIDAYKIANTQYVDSTNVSDYPIPHIAYTNAPYNLVQMSDDGSANYAATILRYEQIRDAAAYWLNDALLGENTGGVDGLLVDIELAWFVDNYALTLANDGTQGLAEYVTNKICSDSTNPILSNSVKAMIYEAVKAGFELVLKDDSTAVYIGATSKKMWDAPLSTHFYSYTWDSAGDYRVNANGSADYAWVYSSSKWQQLDDNGITTGTVDTGTWKWYKVSGKSYKRYGNKKKKRFLHSQWWNINGVWYWFDDEGEATSGADLQNDCYDMFDSISVSSKSIYALLSPICKSAESDLFDILYTQMTDYCTNMFSEEKISYPTPSITIDMVDLSKTVEYAGYSNLLKVKLGDTVKCVNTKLNISTDLRITGLTYDVLKGCNTSIQIGLTETSIISEFDRPVNTDLLAKQGLIAGHGIRIVGNVISTTGTNLTDIVVGGQSVVYGGKAYIDIDEISGEGLQWFEETEDALFGVVDDREVRLIDDAIYRTVSAGCSSDNGAWNFAITGMDTSVITIWFPYPYIITPYYGVGSGEPGGVFLMTTDVSKLESFSVTAFDNWVEPIEREFGQITWNQGTIEGTPIIFTQEDGEPGLANLAMARSAVSIDGETWYCVYFFSGYATCISPMNSIATYIPQPTQGEVLEFESLADVVRTIVPLTRIILAPENHNYNGISREGNLAFFAGADDEHGTNAPIKIYRDGTYKGLDKVEDVKVNGVSVVDENKIAQVTVPSLEDFQEKLIPSGGIVIDDANHIYTGSEDYSLLGVTQTDLDDDWDIYCGTSMSVYSVIYSLIDKRTIAFHYGSGSDIYSKAVYKTKIPKEINYIEFELTRDTNATYGGNLQANFFLKADLETGYIAPDNLFSNMLARTIVNTVNDLPRTGTHKRILDCSGVDVDSYLYITVGGFDLYISEIKLYGRIPPVSITPTLISGKKIADYEIEGVIGSLYAPNGGGTGTQAIAYKYLTPTAYGNLSSAEKENGMLYLISDNGDGSTGFFTNYRVISPTDYENLTTVEKENGTLYLISSNSNNAMGINVVVEDEADYTSASDNLLYLLKEE